MRLPARWRASTSPGWLTWLLLGGLVAVYAGERIVPQLTAARIALTGGGLLLVLAVTAWRFASWRRAAADARNVERLFFLGYAGCALAVIGFLLAGDARDWIGLSSDEPDAADRFDTALTVLSTILLAASLLPVLAAQWATGLRARAPRDAGAIDRLRVSRLAAAGLTVALAGAFLLLTGYVASARDATLDLSYFRTASPGTAVRQITGSLGAPLEVLLFFPPANQVKDQVLGYFRALDGASDNVTIEEYDRLASPALAEEHRVTEDGTIILSVGERTERITLPTSLAEARARLRGLDEAVQRSLMRVARDERTVYLTTGHGELNDPESANPLEATPFRSIGALRSLFGLLNYRVEDLGIQNGLGNEVPADAAMVIVLGPRSAFLDAELGTLDRYLAAGGSVLLALEPESDFDLGPLSERLGVTFHDVPLADDQQHLRQRGNLSDRRLIVTDRFSSHASVSTVGQAGVGSGIALMGSGYLETDQPGSRATIVVRTLPTTFADRDLDFEPDADDDAPASYALVAAVEGDDEVGGDATEEADTTTAGGKMRAMVFADAELFSDAVVTSLGLNAALAADAVRWLGREEELAGETTSEEDVPIVHTRAEDVAWFYATIFGAPLLLLALGLFGVRRRRRGTAERRTG
ncbi:MAG: Gldg family protein [Longimicrobiales bacterium]